jgi:hypothetical protein
MTNELPLSGNLAVFHVLNVSRFRRLTFIFETSVSVSLSLTHTHTHHLCVVLSKCLSLSLTACFRNVSFSPLVFSKCLSLTTCVFSKCLSLTAYVFQMSLSHHLCFRNVSQSRSSCFILHFANSRLFSKYLWQPSRFSFICLLPLNISPTVFHFPSLHISTAVLFTRCLSPLVFYVENVSRSSSIVFYFPNVSCQLSSKCLCNVKSLAM